MSHHTVPTAARPLVLLVAGACAPLACHGHAPAPAARADAAARIVAALDAAAAPPGYAPAARTESPARPAYACTITHPGFDVGHHANITSIALQPAPAAERASQLTVAWTVRPLYAHGGDDLAAVLIDPIHSTYATTLDPEEPSNARGLVRSPANIARVFTVPRRGGWTLATDQLSRDDDDNDLLEAGELSIQIATVDPGTDDATARRVVPGAPFYLRTAYAVAPSFVLGMRAAAGADVVSDAVRFFATRGAVPASRDGDFWPLPVASAASIRHAPNPAAALREIAPEGLEVVALPGVGYALAFQYQRRNYLGWLDPALRPVGEPRVLPASGPSLGLPHVATDGAFALVVYADRDARTGDAAPPRYRLQASRVAFGQGPAAAIALDTGIDADADVFAPSPVAQADGSWWVGFTVGDAEPRANGPDQRVFLRGFDASLAPLSAALQVSGDESMSDPRVLAVPGGLVVAMARGRASPRAVSLATVECTRRARDAGP